MSAGAARKPSQSKSTAGRGQRARSGRKSRFKSRGYSCVFFLVGCFLNFFAARLIDYWSSPNAQNQPPSDITRSIFDINRAYELRVTAGLLQPVAKDTVIVAITPQSEPQLRQGSTCNERLLIASLLNVLRPVHPAVVVIDKYFDPAAQCAQDADLRAAVASIAKDIPVAVASFVPEGQTYEKRGIPLEGDHLLHGLANRHPDHRRIELHRWAYDDARDAASGRPLQPKDWRPTLQLVAAQAFAPNLLDDYPFLREMSERDTPPFTSFAGADTPNADRETSRLRVYTPSWILCGRDSMGGVDDLKQCLQTPGRPGLQPLAGKVVVVGEFSELEDFHETVLGRVQGVILLANYIESLLNRRYFWPAPWWFNVLLGSFLFAAIHIFIGERERKPIALAIAATLVVATAVWFAPRFSYYVNPIGLSLISVGLKIIAALIDGGVGLLQREWRE